MNQEQQIIIKVAEIESVDDFGRTRKHFSFLNKLFAGDPVVGSIDNFYCYDPEGCRSLIISTCEDNVLTCPKCGKITHRVSSSFSIPARNFRSFKELIYNDGQIINNKSGGD